MPTYEVMPTYVPAGNTVEADDAADAIQAEIEAAVELMSDESNWTATEVDDAS